MLDENEPEKLTSNVILDSNSLLANGVEKEKKVEEKPKLTGLTISNVTASWQADSVVDTLRNITLKAAPGEFVGVAGPVGSGKVRFLKTKFPNLSFVLRRSNYLRITFLSANEPPNFKI